MKKNEFENYRIAKADVQITSSLELVSGSAIGSVHIASDVQRMKRINSTNTIPSLILIRGLPGSGKSTLARGFELKGFTHFEADQFFQTKYGYKFDVKKIAKAHAKCIKDTRNAIKANKQVVVSNCFARLSELIAYLKLSPFTLIIETNGAWKNIHGVKEETINKMAQLWQALSS